MTNKLSRLVPRGYVPHFSAECQTQTVTFRLIDSMPQAVLDRWRAELQHLAPKEYDLVRRKRIDAYLDRGYGSCWLQEERLARLVQESLLFFDEARYRLHAWCVMPNHVHILFTPQLGWELGRIVQTWKSYTAHEGNKLLARTGEFWQTEPFDRYVRDATHYANALRYIEHNPVKANLCPTPETWPWSSAHYCSLP